uniref:Syntaxin 6/10/61 N-terminal domain-containing protein n=1 Tax=Physcomitrium patens TaxID=3218 RepID=A0A7I4F1V4_PHYPA
MSLSDPFYLVKLEIQDTVTKLQSTFARWEQLPFSSTERSVLSKELLSSCENIEWQMQLRLSGGENGLLKHETRSILLLGNCKVQYL